MNLLVFEMFRIIDMSTLYDLRSIGILLGLRISLRDIGWDLFCLENWGGFGWYVLRWGVGLKILLDLLDGRVVL